MKNLIKEKEVLTFLNDEEPAFGRDKRIEKH